MFKYILVFLAGAGIGIAGFEYARNWQIRRDVSQGLRR